MAEPGEVLLSASAISTYMRCGEKYRRRYEEKDYRPGGLALHVGTAAHESARASHRNQMKAKADAGLDGITLGKAVEKGAHKDLLDVLATSALGAPAVKDIAATEFEKSVEEKGFALDPDETDSPEKAKGKAKDEAVRHAEGYVGPSRLVNPMTIERWIEVRPKGSTLVLRGAIDLIDGTEAGEVIVDRKTSAKTPNESRAHGSLQLSMYAALRYAETHELVPALRLDTTVALKGGTKFVQHETKRTFADVRDILDRSVQVARGIASGTFVPSDPDQWWCSAKFCEYYSDCKYTAGRRFRSIN